MATSPMEACPSTTTSTITPTEASSLANQNKMTTTNKEVQPSIPKVNEKVPPKPQDQSSKDDHDLKLSTGQQIQPNAIEVKDGDSSRPAAGSLMPAGSLRAAASSNHGKKKENSADFNCRYCRRSYNSAYALGGHLNAHRRERQIEKSGQPMESMDYPHSYFNSLQNLAQNPPLHYSPYNIYLGGCLMPLMAIRPYSSGPTLAGIPYGYGGGISLSQPGMSNPLAVGNSGVQLPSASRFDGLGPLGAIQSGGGPLPNIAISNNGHSNAIGSGRILKRAGASRFDGVGATVSSAGGPFRATVRADGGPVPNIGISNNGPGNGIGSGRISKRARIGTHQEEPEPVREELDLTLKL